MGIQGLLSFLKESSVNCNVKEFRGKTAAIDGYCWLHKGAFSCADKLVKGEKTNAYVTYCMKYVNMLISNGVQPVMVFDGQPLPSKLGTEIERRENRERYKMKAREFLRQGKTGDARKCFQKCVDISSEMALELMKACRAKKVDCIVAPYEADAQLAYLSLQGMVDLVITEDSDLLAFGCARVFFKMDLNGQGVLIERDKLCLSLGNRADFFNFEKFRRVCILSGCDYLPSLPGIGLGKAFKFFSRSTDVDINAALCRLPSCLNMPQLDVSPEYREAFIKAEQTFLYQLVYDPVIRKLVPLTPYPEGADPLAFPFAGGYLEDETAFQLAVGNLNVDTLTKICNFHPDDVTRLKMACSIWSGTKRSAVTPINAPVNALSPSVGGPSPLSKQIRTKVEFSLPVVISDNDLAVQYSTNTTGIANTQLNSPPGSPILGYRKRKRSDENDPTDGSSPSSSRTPKGSNPFAKLKQNTPSPDKGRTLRASLSQCIEVDSSGQEIITSSYFSSSCVMNVTDRLIKSVGERQSHLTNPVKSSKAVQCPFKPVLTSATSATEIIPKSILPTGISASSIASTSVKESSGSRPVRKNDCRVAGLSRTAMQSSRVNGGGMRQLSLRDMLKQ